MAACVYAAVSRTWAASANRAGKSTPAPPLNWGVASPFLVLAALVAAAMGSSEEFTSLLWFAACIALLCSAWWCARPLSQTLSPRLSWIAVCVVALSLWLLVDGLLQYPYTPFPIYHAALLGFGFFAGRRMAGPGIEPVLRCMLPFALALALWALWQLAFKGGTRPHALFDTPATFSAVLNMVLVPCVAALALSGKPSRGQILVTMLLTAALFAANARGGWLAFAGAGLVCFFLAKRAEIAIQRANQWALAGVLTGGWILAQLVGFVGLELGTAVYTLPKADMGLSLLARLNMYELALHSISFATLPTGMGYSAFHYLLRRHPDAVPDYTHASTFFVHDDYLQALLELGLPACAGLLALATLPLASAWRVLPALGQAPDRATLIIALTGALASMALHALVDFPFYIPACVVMYGFTLGMLDGSANALSVNLSGKLCHGLQKLKAFSGVGLLFLAAIASWLIFASAGSEAAFRIAMGDWVRGQNEDAAYWFTVAQRLQPRDWRYHVQAAQFWYAQAEAAGNPAAARLADRSYASAYQANRNEPLVLLGRIALHRKLGHLLDSRAASATLLEWANEALEMSPSSPIVRRERDLLLREFAAPRPDGQNDGLMKEGRRRGAS
jgi:O-Antigen ligase